MNKCYSCKSRQETLYKVLPEIAAMTLRTNANYNFNAIFYLHVTKPYRMDLENITFVVKNVTTCL